LTTELAFGSQNCTGFGLVSQGKRTHSTCDIGSEKGKAFFRKGSMAYNCDSM